MRVQTLVLAGAVLWTGGLQVQASTLGSGSPHEEAGATSSAVPATGTRAEASAAAGAQMSGPPPSPAIGTKEEPAKALDGLLSMLEFQVVGAAKAMPADKYSFAPAASIFAPGQATQFDTVRSFVAQVTHLAQANYFFFSWSGIKPDRDVKAIGSITSKEEAVAALQASFAYAHKAVATITAENAFVAIKPIDGFSTRATIAAFAAAHGNDHYGQMVEYLRMNAIIPPASAR